MLLQVPLVIVSALIFCSFLTGELLNAHAQPSFRDPNLEAELIVEGLSSPTSIAFIDGNNILVLEKNSGEVRLVNNSH
jgi:aldose sugar dehydrogenase